MPVIFLLLALAADPQLEALRAQLEPMRVHPEKIEGPRGATPALTAVKHRLLDWVESRLKSFDGKDVPGFERSLNQELKAAKLICETGCPGWFDSGYVAEIRVSRKPGYLVILTGVGIACGFDQSIYIYQNTDSVWTRLWANEQNDYTKDGYKPQYVNDVEVYADLILTLGHQTWCSSNWHDVYYRLYRLGTDEPLIDGSEWAYVSTRDPIRGRLKKNDVLLEYEARGIEGGFTRQAVRHYEITDQGARRVAPIALDPRGFVFEWITNDWSEAGRWSEATARQSLSNWHKRVKGTLGSITEDTTRCATTPDIWQVSTELKTPAYFFVRWTPPYRFSMVRVASEPSPDCRRRDPEADAFHTLFADWR